MLIYDRDKIITEVFLDFAAGHFCMKGFSLNEVVVFIAVSFGHSIKKLLHYCLRRTGR